MRGHDSLAVARRIHPPHQFQEFHLARGRQGRFRLVEDEDTLALTTLLEEAHKTLAVRIREEVRRRAADLVEISRDGKETLGPEEPAVGNLRQPTRAKCRREFSAHHLPGI